MKGITTRWMMITAGAIGLAVVLSSCETALLGPMPVYCSAATVTVADRGDLHSIAGLYCSIANVTNEVVRGLELDFALYDDEGDPFPAFAANAFRTTVSVPILPGETVSLCVSLDACVPQGDRSLIARRFHVASVEFANGRRWINPAGFLFTGVER